MVYSYATIVYCANILYSAIGKVPDSDGIFFYSSFFWATISNVWVVILIVFRFIMVIYFSFKRTTNYSRGYWNWWITGRSNPYFIYNENCWWAANSLYMVFDSGMGWPTNGKMSFNLNIYSFFEFILHSESQNQLDLIDLFTWHWLINSCKSVPIRFLLTLHNFLSYYLFYFGFLNTHVITNNF